MLFKISTIAVLAAVSAAMPTRRAHLPSTELTTREPAFSYRHGVQGHQGRNDSSIEKRWSCNTSPTSSSGDSDDGGKGVTIKNADSEKRGYYVYHNSCDSIPYKYVWIDAGESAFISIPDNFQGRITRGTDEYSLDVSSSNQWVGTWFEIGLDSTGTGWADVSLIRGCDGGITIESLDGTGASTGFSQWILDGAPSGAYSTKQDGEIVLSASENLDSSINTVVRDWFISEVGATNAYVDDYHGDPVIQSSNGRFATTWEAGRP